MIQEKINRINELAKKSKTKELSEEEKNEQTVLRQEYINAVKENLISNIENIIKEGKEGN